MKLKIMFIFAGIIFSLIFLEFLLYLSGLILPFYLKKDIDISLEEGSRVICVGDSFTYGLGVEENETYPYYLKKILNDYSSEKNFSVLNLGYPGVNSNYVLKNIENNLKKYNPEIAIIQVGSNNYNNFDGLIDQESIFNDIYFRFKNLRIVRFLDLIGKNMIKKQNEEKNIKSDKKRKPFDTVLDKNFKYEPEFDFKIENTKLEDDKEKDDEIEIDEGKINLLKNIDFEFKSNNKFSVLTPDKSFSGEKWDFIRYHDYKNAEKMFSKKLSNSEDYYGLGLSLFLQGKISSFKRTVKNGLYLFPDDEYLNSINLWILLEEGKFNNIIEFLIEDFKDYNGDISKFFILSEIFNSLEDFEKSVLWAEKGNKYMPEDEIINFLTGKAFLEAGKINKAKFYFKKDMEKNNRFSENLSGLVRTYFYSEDYNPGYDLLLKIADNEFSLFNLDLLFELCEKFSEDVDKINFVKIFKIMIDYLDSSERIKLVISENPDFFFYFKYLCEIYVENEISLKYLNIFTEKNDEKYSYAYFLFLKAYIEHLKSNIIDFSDVLLKLDVFEDELIKDDIVYFKYKTGNIGNIEILEHLSNIQKYSKNIEILIKKIAIEFEENKIEKIYFGLIFKMLNNLEKISEKKHNIFVFLYKLGNKEYLYENDFNLAEKNYLLAEKIAETENEKISIYKMLSSFYFHFGKYDHSLNYIKKILPLVSTDKKRKLLEYIAKHHKLLGDFKNAKLIYKNLNDQKNYMLMEKFEEDKKNKRDIEDWILNDIKKIIYICRKNKVQPVILNYFEHEMLYLKNYLLKNKIAFIDNYEVFQEFKKKDGLKFNRGKYFSKDNIHLSPYGNKKSAELIFSKIKRLIK